MRPRLGSRGEPRYASPFLAAYFIALQCGHGSLAVENDLAVLSVRPVVTASMGPRLGSRGEPHLFNGGIHLHHASMRPRLGSRGEPIRRKAVRLRMNRLQCGHGSKTVENDNLSEQCLSADSPASMRPRPKGRGELR